MSEARYFALSLNERRSAAIYIRVKPAQLVKKFPMLRTIMGIMNSFIMLPFSSGSTLGSKISTIYLITMPYVGYIRPFISENNMPRLT